MRAGQNTSGQPLEGPTDSEIVSSLDPRRVWKRVRKHAAHGKRPSPEPILQPCKTLCMLGVLSLQMCHSLWHE